MSKLRHRPTSSALTCIQVYAMRINGKRTATASSICSFNPALFRVSDLGSTNMEKHEQSIVAVPSLQFHREVANDDVSPGSSNEK